MFGRRDRSREGKVGNEFRFEGLEQLAFLCDLLARVGFDTSREFESGIRHAQGIREDVEFGDFEKLVKTYIDHFVESVSSILSTREYMREG